VVVVPYEVGGASGAVGDGVAAGVVAVDSAWQVDAGGEGASWVAAAAGEKRGASMSTARSRVDTPLTVLGRVGDPVVAYLVARALSYREDARRAREAAVDEGEGSELRAMWVRIAATAETTMRELESCARHVAALYVR